MEQHFSSKRFYYLEYVQTKTYRYVVISRGKILPTACTFSNLAVGCDVEFIAHHVENTHVFIAR